MSSRLKVFAGLLCVAQVLGVSTAFAAEGSTSASGPAAAGDVVVRLRGLAVVPDERSTVTPIGGKVDADNAFVPEVDFTYYVTDKIALELIAAVTKHSNVDVGSTLGDVALGSVWLLPPTLTVQYHFYQFEKLGLYAGAGINYTHMFSVKKPSTGPVTSISYADSVGPALQLGGDYDVGNNWSLNLDVKKVWISSDVAINGGAIMAKAHLDPWIVGAGFGYRF